MAQTQIIQSFTTKNRKYQKQGYFDNTADFKFKGIFLHSVGCSQPDPKVFVNNWNKYESNVAVHAVIGADGSVYQCLPWMMLGWHGGSIYSNNHYIGVEMTEPAGITYTGGATWYFNNEQAAREHIANTYRTAKELFAYLCTEYGLDPLEDGVILSHAEGAKRGIATAHADVEHIWDKVGLTMDDFRRDVYDEMTKGNLYADKVTLLYADLLGRVPDEAGLEGWIDVMISKGFEAVYNGIANSKEGIKYYIRCLYRSMLKREANSTEVDYWLKVKDRLSIYTGIINSAEYKKKH